jgi:cytochrome c oxidase subunit 3
MWLFLSSELLLFAGMFALYAAYRVMYPHDFAAAVAHTNLALGTANTAIMLTSGLFVAQAVGCVRNGRPRRCAGYLLAGIAGGVAFLILKVAEYIEHFHAGLGPGIAFQTEEINSYGARMFFSLYYLMTGFHGLHVIAGIMILSYLVVNCIRGRSSAEYPTRVEVGALYWSLVDIVWIFLWTLLYLLRSPG